MDAPLEASAGTAFSQLMIREAPLSKTWYAFLRPFLAYYPAGSVNHHSGIGGLHDHILEMIYLFNSWVEKETPLCVVADHAIEKSSYDEVILAILLHDLEKCLGLYEETYQIRVCSYQNKQITDTDNLTYPYLPFLPFLDEKEQNAFFLSSDQQILLQNSMTNSRTGKHTLTGDEKQRTILEWFLRQNAKNQGYLFHVNKSFSFRWSDMGKDLVRIRFVHELVDLFHLPMPSHRVLDTITFAHLGYSDIPQRKTSFLTKAVGMLDYISAHYPYEIFPGIDMSNYYLTAQEMTRFHTDFAHFHKETFFHD